MSGLFSKMLGFRGRWAKAKRQADRIAQAIAEDQLVAWALHPDGRRRNQAVRGWADMLRSMAPA